ncbi:MAG: preprotein translocase subunit SecE [Deltaproteobacteria bacterium]|nr:preprotein translocase subunit SecE [Deltaproteobacteria bacterium]
MSTNKAIKSGKNGKPAKQAGPEEGSKFELAAIKEFVREVKNEFEKVAWPDKKHTVATAGVVFILVIMISFYLGAVDLILGKLIGLVIK